MSRRHHSVQFQDNAALSESPSMLDEQDADQQASRLLRSLSAVLSLLQDPFSSSGAVAAIEAVKLSPAMFAVIAQLNPCISGASSLTYSTSPFLSNPVAA